MRLVGVREAIGQYWRAGGCEKRNSKHDRFHDVSPNQCPVAELPSGIAWSEGRYRQQALPITLCQNDVL